MPLSPIFEFADLFVAEQAALDPCQATVDGIPGYDTLLTDYSPEGYQARAGYLRLSTAELAALDPTNDHIVSPRIRSSSDSRRRSCRTTPASGSA